MDATSPEAARWLGKLSALNVDAAKKTRPIGAAPHKPLLMLVVCDLVEEGALAFRFGTYWRIVGDRRRTKPDLRLPFFHIRSDEFWRPLEADGRPAETREHAVLAQLDVSFLLCLQDAEFRTLARRTLIAKYFEPAERAELYSLVGLPVPPDDIIATDATRFLVSDSEEKKRDAKFSVRVLPAYDFTCALTRYRMIAVDGTTPLDAAHIHQFKRGGSCHPTNGLALSKTAAIGHLMMIAASSSPRTNLTNPARQRSCSNRVLARQFFCRQIQSSTPTVSACAGTVSGTDLLRER